MTLPSWMYSRDPAEIVADGQIRELGCRACDHCVPALGRMYCSNDKAEKNHKRVPKIGPNCKFFVLKG